MIEKLILIIYRIVNRISKELLYRIISNFIWNYIYFIVNDYCIFFNLVFLKIKNYYNLVIWV